MNDWIKPVIVFGIIILVLVVGAIAIKFYYFSDDPLVELGIVEETEEKAPIHVTQFSSHRTKDEAARAVEIHSNKYPDLFRSSDLKVFRVELDSGTWYRVLLPTETRTQSEALCNTIKSRGGDCLVLSFN